MIKQEEKLIFINNGPLRSCDAYQNLITLS